MSPARVFNFDARIARRHLIACERARLKHKQITPEEMSRLVIATKGERFNFDLLGKVLAERLRLKEQR